MLLGDLGADVIKVEAPDGDPIRGQGAMRDGLSWYFAAFNRNKRSVRLDLRQQAGREVLARLIERADVLVENFRPGVLARLGFDDARLQALRPSLVTCSINGFGSTGPYRDRPAFDFIAQAMSGFMSVNGGAGRSAAALRRADLRPGRRAVCGAEHRRLGACGRAPPGRAARRSEPDQRAGQHAGLYRQRLFRHRHACRHAAATTIRSPRPTGCSPRAMGKSRWRRPAMSSSAGWRTRWASRG